MPGASARGPKEAGGKRDKVIKTNRYTQACASSLCPAARYIRRLRLALTYFEAVRRIANGACASASDESLLVRRYVCVCVEREREKVYAGKLSELRRGIARIRGFREAWLNGMDGRAYGCKCG